MNDERNEQKYFIPVKAVVTSYHAYEAHRFFRATPRSYGKAGLFAAAAMIGTVELVKDFQIANLKK